VARRKKENTDPGAERLIKRYGNRKLYDTQQSRYVTLDEISQMVRRGEEIRVVDNKTQEDLTAVTLTQIMLEEQKNKNNILPLSLCKNLIQEGGDRLSDWLHKGKESLNTMRIEAEEHIARLIEKGHDKNIDERIRYFFYQLTGLDELEKQLQELESQLGHLEERLSLYDG